MASVPSSGKEVVGTDELGTVIGTFEMLAGGVLGVAENFGAALGTRCSLSWNSSGSLPACGRLLTASSVTLLTDAVDVATLSSTHDDDDSVLRSVCRPASDQIEH